MSLLALFLILNTLSILDGFLTVTGIKLGVFQEKNPIVLFYINILGLYRGMFTVKLAGLIFSGIVFSLQNQLGVSGVKCGFITLIVLYAALVTYQVFQMVSWAFGS